MEVFKKLCQFWQTIVVSKMSWQANVMSVVIQNAKTKPKRLVDLEKNLDLDSHGAKRRLATTLETMVSSSLRQQWFVAHSILAILLIFCNPCSLCLAEDEASEISSLDEIEQGLLNQNSDAEPSKIEREDLPKLEDKKKESISSEINYPQESGAFSYKKIAKIIILNKITAKSELIEFKLGKVKLFGNLSVEVHKCAKNTDPLKSSNLVLLTVFDNKFDDNKLLVFHGWMDSSNLSISTLEHPVYEVIPMDCVD